MIHPRIVDKPLGAIVGKLPRRLYGFMAMVSSVASPLILAGIVMIVIIISAIIGNDQLAWAGAIVLLLSPVAEFSKFITRRHRPETLYAENMRLKTYSFPSGHAYVSALVFGFLAITAITWLTYGMLLAVVLIFLAFLVGVSRVYLGAHFPSDVIAGWTMGFAAQYLVWIKAGL